MLSYYFVINLFSNSFSVNFISKSSIRRSVAIENDVDTAQASSNDLVSLHSTYATPFTPCHSDVTTKTGIVTRTFSNVRNPYLKQIRKNSVNENDFLRAPSISNAVTPLPYQPLVHVKGTFSGKPLSKESLDKANQVLFSARLSSMNKSCVNSTKECRFSKPRILNYDHVLQDENDADSMMLKSSGSRIKLSELKMSNFNSNEIDTSSCVTMSITSTNAVNLYFDETSGLPITLSGEFENVPGNGFGLHDFYRTLLSIDLVSRDKLTLCWVRNHFRWIVWKLASVERSFTQYFSFGDYLCKNRVFNQLTARYKKEFINGHRSALRKVLNRDEPAGRLIILCVSQISQCVEGNESSSLKTFKLELTDGW